MDEHRRPAVVLGVDPDLHGVLAWIGPDGAEVRHADARRRPWRRASLLRCRDVRPGRGLARRTGRARGGRADAEAGCDLDLPLRRRLRPLAGHPRGRGRPPTGRPSAGLDVDRAGRHRQDKAAAIAFAERRFPDLPLQATPRSRVPHGGIADALRPAEYARRNLLGAGPDLDELSRSQTTFVSIFAAGPRLAAGRGGADRGPSSRPSDSRRPTPRGPRTRAGCPRPINPGRVISSPGQPPLADRDDAEPGRHFRPHSHRSAPISPPTRSP